MQGFRAPERGGHLPWRPRSPRRQEEKGLRSSKCMTHMTNQHGSSTSVANPLWNTFLPVLRSRRAEVSQHCPLPIQKDVLLGSAVGGAVEGDESEQSWRRVRTRLHERVRNTSGRILRIRYSLPNLAGEGTEPWTRRRRRHVSVSKTENRT